MKMLWIETCDDCKWCNSVGLTKMCGHPGFRGKGRSREIKNGTIPADLCPLPDAVSEASEQGGQHDPDVSTRLDVVRRIGRRGEPHKPEPYSPLQYQHVVDPVSNPYKLEPNP